MTQHLAWKSRSIDSHLHHAVRDAQLSNALMSFNMDLHPRLNAHPYLQALGMIAAGSTTQLMVAN